MQKSRPYLHALAGIFLLLPTTVNLANAAPQNFSQAKTELRKKVYHDLNKEGTIYCGCSWEWKGSTGGVTDLPSCDYTVRAQATRANRIEYEHIVPAHTLGNLRQCWKEGGRKNCGTNDPLYSIMESDGHNLHIAVGEVNADRSNYQFGMIPGNSVNYGKCDFKVDFKNKVAEPGDHAKGMIARVYFYMHDRYNLPMSRQQQQLFMAWDKMFPVTDSEKRRDDRTAKVMGHHNPFVTGARKWELGHKNTGDGLHARVAAYKGATTSPTPQSRVSSAAVPATSSGIIKGNKNSKIYHLPVGCASYNAMLAKNSVMFSTESEAISAGYRKARNCK